MKPVPNNPPDDFSEPLIHLAQKVRILTDLLNDRKYEAALSVALDATTECYKVYDYARGQVRARGQVLK